ncbi:MAG: YebC/PmpR family DNA-binding transcriptional regulator [Candidatus Buchananbacteria bacterium]|nr:YebC/PmpR family DNA-binding transcriptional regulator [Candidatus Buchananbacteria bacterium]
MSGHSKWATTHRQKEVADAKRGFAFTKLGKAITIAAKLGGGDLTANFRLRLAIDKAKAASMPKDNIERAIKRGTGELNEGQIESLTYEGFGPHGVAFILECLTDNRNRTASEIKHLFSKSGGSLGSPNSVSWMFSQKGVIRISKMTDELELELIDAGVNDIIEEDNGVTIYCEMADLKKIKDLLEEKKIEVSYAQIEWVAKEKKILTSDQQADLEKFFEILEENEDIDNYYSNAEI